MLIFVEFLKMSVNMFKAFAKQPDQGDEIEKFISELYLKYMVKKLDERSDNGEEMVGYSFK